MKKAIGVMLGLLTFASTQGGSAQAQGGSEPYMTFTIPGALKIKKSTGSDEQIDYESYKATKSLGEAIAAAPNPIECEERNAKAGEETAPVVTFTITTPMFSVKRGLAPFCKIYYPAPFIDGRRNPLYFKVKHEVRNNGVTG
jgi:hypothetical protein